ncbi:MAG: hypothetical protein ACLQO6_12710 [Desulfomonilaceae bacterium]
MRRTSQVNRNGIRQIRDSENSRNAILFDVDPETRTKLRQISRETGISQKRILEAGTRRQLRELERQLLQGVVGVSEPQIERN